MFHDRRYEAELNAAAESAGEAAAGALGDLGGGDLGDLGGGDLGDLGGGEDLGDLGGGEDFGGEEEEGALLAAPAKRNDDRDDRNRRHTKKSLGKKAKGKRHVSKELRGGDGRNGREHNYTAMAFPRAKETIPGMSNLMGLSRGIYEIKQPNYNTEEALLFEASSRVRDLVEELENAEIQIDENET